jgi:hypothetical protein
MKPAIFLSEAAYTHNLKPMVDRIEREQAAEEKRVEEEKRARRRAARAAAFRAANAACTPDALLPVVVVTPEQFAALKAENPPYPFCVQPEVCCGLGRCPRIPVCNE